MMNYTTGWGYGLVTLWGLHVLSVIVFFTGVLLFIVLAIRTFTPAQLKSWAIWLMIIGTIVCLFTIGVTGRPWIDYGMGGFGNARMMPMMWGGGWQTQSDSATTQEEAEGKTLYDKLQAKQTSCADLSDDDFDLIGDYFMGQQMGAAHGQINTMMQQMMGEAAEKQMHIIMGKRLSGCTTGSSAQFPQGMMNGGGMMQRLNASSEASQIDTHHTSSSAAQ